MQVINPSSTVLLALLIAVLSSYRTDGRHIKCARWRGAEYRDCTCGLQYKDVEERCCSATSCFNPTLRSENLTCPFQCMNGGVYHSRYNFCNCTGTGHYGLCCERGTLYLCAYVRMHACIHKLASSSQLQTTHS